MVGYTSRLMTIA